jgi:hypothetical protein
MAAGNVVGIPLTDDFDRARRVEQLLHAKLRREIFAVDPSVRFRTWIDRGELSGPSGEYAGHGFRLNFSLKDANAKLRNVIDAQPTSFEQYELWHHDWDDAPPTNI